MNLQDALLYWLQIKTVAEMRPDDDAAKETLRFFETILDEDHHLQNYRVTAIDDDMVHIAYEQNGEIKTDRFPKLLVDQLLEDINANPKYN